MDENLVGGGIIGENFCSQVRLKRMMGWKANKSRRRKGFIYLGLGPVY